MAKRNKKGYAFRCKACNSMLTPFENSKLLPNSQEDDLCNKCLEAISSCEYMVLVETPHSNISEGMTPAHYSLDYFDNK